MIKAKLMSWIQEGNLSIPCVLLNNYRNMKLNEQEFVLLLQVLNYMENGNDFPTPVELADRMSVSATECSSMLRSLIQKGFIQIIDGQTSEGIRYETYSLEPMWEKLVDFFLLQKKGLDVETKHKQEQDLYSCFEAEFGRPLSPFECETMTMWIDDDQHEPTMIKAALKEAVISGKLNFRYIDRILFEWKKNGVKTIEQAKSYSSKFRRHQTQNKPQNESTNTQAKAVPFYNWLEQ